MKFYYSVLIFLLLGNAAMAQVPKTIIDSSVQTQKPAGEGTVEEQLESATANNSDNATEDDSYWQLLRQYSRSPMNLNTASQEDMESLQLLTPLQIQNILSYRKIFGKFINIYELQAVPTLDIASIQKILPYVDVSNAEDLFTAVGKRFRGGSSSLLVRDKQTPEKSRGYTDYPKGDSSNHIYPGSPEHIFLRYKYSYKNLMQYGFTADKDAGEQLFKGGQKQGFDFYSAHFFLRNVGIIKALALGDYTVNLGQGLTQWQSLAFGKSAGDVLNIKRQSPVINPYSSPGEIFFNRGAAVTLAKKAWEATVFGSYRKMDASVNNGADSSSVDDYISSIESSGYHRTTTELKNKGVVGQTTYGGNIAYNKNMIHIGINAVQYKFSVPLQKTLSDSIAGEPYNLYRKLGDNFGNYSVDYSYTYKNLHFFGEAATTNNNYYATVNGLLLSVDPTVDMSFLYRNVSKGYQALYANAFMENSTVENEKGLYSAISIHPNPMWHIDAYADFYRFPWLKFQVDAPTNGSDYQVQVTYTPNKQLMVYTRYHAETKPKNLNPDDLPLSPVVPVTIQDWRIDLSYKLTPSLIFRTRQEMSWYNKHGDSPENGFLIYADLLDNPKGSKWSGNVRLQYFETDSYNSRLYAYENTVLYDYSIPVFYGKGYRYYINLNYDVNKRLSFWCRWAQTIYKDQATVGSGYDLIQGNTRSEITLQGIYRF